MGTGGLPGALGAPGLLATGGAGGFGLFATGGGGGFPASELPGREFVGVLSAAEPFVDDGAFFQGVAEPFAGIIPGKTDTGLAEASATTDFGAFLAVGAAGAGGTADARFAPAPGAGGGGGGGGGAAAAFGFGGTSSR